jgi:MFS family permease
MASCFADYLGMAMMTPALPYFLADLGMNAKAVATWTGAITTAQYAGAACGNMVVGAMGDSLGSRATLGLTLAGDVLFFTITAFSKNVAVLTAVRCFAGLSSPLVASLHYVLRRARNKKHTLEGVNAYSASVNAGYAVGSVVVGLGYDGLGWVGLNLLSAAVAGLAMVVVLVLVKNDRPKKSPSIAKYLGNLADEGVPSVSEDEKNVKNQRNEKDQKKKFSVYRSGEMMSHMITAVNVGYQFMGFLVLFTLMTKQILGWSATTLGWSFMAIPVVNTFVQYYFIPPLIQKFGVHALITYSSLATMGTLGAFAVPAVHNSPAGIMIITVCLILCVVTVQVPNQMRIKIIADQYAPEEMGRITGASRVCFAVGQTASPVCCAVLYTIHPSLAIVSMFLAVVTVPLAFWICKQSFFQDPAIADKNETNEI